MKAVCLIILVMYLLQPLACFADPCESCHGMQGVEDTSSGTSGSHNHSQDSDCCDSTICCAGCITQNPVAVVKYAPLISAVVPAERHRMLPTVVIPIFIPPQNAA